MDVASDSPAGRAKGIRPPATVSMAPGSLDFPVFASILRLSFRDGD